MRLTKLDPILDSGNLKLYTLLQGKRLPITQFLKGGGHESQRAEEGTLEDAGTEPWGKGSPDRQGRCDQGISDLC
jgi:hypothetical protein